MGLAFLVPAFLAGILAVSIPIWVHLRNRPKTETVEFPSLMFLERIPYRAVQRQQLRHRLLFAARCLAIVLLVLAFARPFLFGVDLTGATVAADREVVILVDRSWSMDYSDRWARAMSAAGDAIRGLGPGDRASLIAFDEAAEVLVESGSDAAALTAALGNLRPGLAATRYDAGLRAAARILAGTDKPVGEVVLVSDFQRVGWNRDEELRMPEGTVLRPVSVVEAPARNAGVAAVALQRLPGDDENPDRVAVSARLTRQGGEAPEPVEVALEIAGEVVERQRVDLPSNGSLRVDFAPREASPEQVAGSVRIDADALAADDEFHFVASPGQVVSVLLLDNPRASGSDSLYVERALRVGTQPSFRIERAALTDLRPGDLTDHDLVILNDVGAIDAGTLAALQGHVAGGGGLVLGFAELTSTRPGDLVPFAPAGEVNRSLELGATLASIDSDHPALEVFRSPESGDLAAARFYRYRALDPVPADGVLARFDDGAPALVELRGDAGRVLVWTSSFDVFWTDLPLKPVFVPMIHEVAKYAAGYREADAWLTAGATVAVREIAAAVARGGASAVPTAVRIGGMPAGAGADATVALAAGFHDVTWDGGQATVAANLDRAEADLSGIDPEELAAAVVWQGQGEVESGADADVTPGQIEARQSVWWYLLVLAAILLILETALSNRLSPRASSNVTTGTMPPRGAAL